MKRKRPGVRGTLGQQYRTWARKHAPSPEPQRTRVRRIESGDGSFLHRTRPGSDVGCVERTTRRTSGYLSASTISLISCGIGASSTITRPSRGWGKVMRTACSAWRRHCFRDAPLAVIARDELSPHPGSSDQTRRQPDSNEPRANNFMFLVA